MELRPGDYHTVTASYSGDGNNIFDIPTVNNDIISHGGGSIEGLKELIFLVLVRILTYGCCFIIK